MLRSLRRRFGLGFLLLLLLTPTLACKSEVERKHWREIAYCDTFKDPTARISCITNFAVQAKNGALCEKAPQLDSRPQIDNLAGPSPWTCFARVATFTGDIELCDRMKEAPDLTCYVHAAAAGGGAKACDRLREVAKDEKRLLRRYTVADDLKGIIQVDSLACDAVVQKSPAPCDALSGHDKSFCNGAYMDATRDPAACATVTDNHNRHACFLRLATDLERPELCDRTSGSCNEFEASSCNLWTCIGIAAKAPTPAACLTHKANQLKDRDQCLAQWVTRGGAPAEACQHMQDPAWKQICERKQ